LETLPKNCQRMPTDRNR